MTPPRVKAPPPRVALSPSEAAEAMGCGQTFFDREIRPDLRLVRRGSKVLVPLSELEAWTERNAERTLAKERDVGRQRP